ncbi:hypothetical protein GQF01_11985 [Paenibacillus sp. 5J-6]|uniref:LPXTG cell wall anchor domain-containing protein n=1 Tax=Paenibacillus silvestris TaxID=2606219 RepID=A0A6L8UX47_9BACL|nr:hypothetical protein [Paenibacillus silvestris]MZQ82823.1 hypothetical protein [Paenibacillus silvestris]
MKRQFLAGLMAVLTALIILPVSAMAYSYGDANTEDVAETFKLVQSSIGNGANDWNAAEGAYQERRAEIVSHFGEAVGSTLDANFKAKDSKAVIANFKGVLVMNLDRRFTYAIQGIDDYAASKLLLAKAKATYDTLQPYMGSGTADIEKAFDEALDALGNPGLFGVGKKPVQPDVFKEKVGFIYGKVKPLFPYQAAAAPVASSEPTPVAQPTETPKTEPVVKSEPTPAQEQPVLVEKEAKPAETKAPDVAAAVETKAPEPSASASASPSPSAAPTAEAASPTPAASAAATTAPAKAADTASTTVKQAEPAKEASAHAPMQRTDKTNSFVSIAVIGGVIVLLGGGVWFARKRKWI